MYWMSISATSTHNVQGMFTLTTTLFLEPLITHTLYKLCIAHAEHHKEIPRTDVTHAQVQASLRCCSMCTIWYHEDSILAVKAARPLVSLRTSHVILRLNKLFFKLVSFRIFLQYGNEELVSVFWRYRTLVLTRDGSNHSALSNVPLCSRITE